MAEIEDDPHEDTCDSLRTIDQMHAEELDVIAREGAANPPTRPIQVELEMVRNEISRLGDKLGLLCELVAVMVEDMRKRSG